MTIKIVIEQILSMNILALSGFWLYRLNILSKNTINQLTNFLLKIIGYFIIVNAIINTLNKETSKSFFNAFLLALILNLIYIFTLTLIYRKKEPVISFGSVFSNASFMGIPLINALIGNQGILYLIPFLIVQIIGQWTYGIWQMDKNYLPNFKNTFKIILLNPAMLGLFTGLLIYFSGFNLPNFLLISINDFAKLNTPLAMIILGTLINEIKLSDFKLFKKILTVCLLRLIIIPLITILFFYLLKNENNILITTFIICSCAPSPISTAMFALKFNQNIKLAVVSIATSTIIAIISIPFILYLSQILKIIK